MSRKQGHSTLPLFCLSSVPLLWSFLLYLMLKTGYPFVWNEEQDVSKPSSVTFLLSTPPLPVTVSVSTPCQFLRNQLGFCLLVLFFSMLYFSFLFFLSPFAKQHFCFHDLALLCFLFSLLEWDLDLTHSRQMLSLDLYPEPFTCVPGCWKCNSNITSAS